VECVTQKEEINAGPGAFAETEASTAFLPLQLPSLGEAATVSISSKEDWELPLLVENTSIENMPAITRPFPLTQAGMILYFPTFTEAIANPKPMERRMSILRAAINGDEASMAFLLGEDDSHLSFTNAYSRTPLSLAAENGHEGVVRQMLERNDIAINYADLDGQTALAWAASNGHSAIVRLLLEQDDLDANSKDVDGNTPLSWAAMNGYDTVVALLLERYDVAVSAVNNYGRTPLSLATGNGHECIARRLSSWDGGLSLATLKHYAT
jgi:Ankyrin repeats (3 copies)